MGLVGHPPDRVGHSEKEQSGSACIVNKDDMGGSQHCIVPGFNPQSVLISAMRVLRLCGVLERALAFNNSTNNDLQKGAKNDFWKSLPFGSREHRKVTRFRSVAKVVLSKKPQKATSSPVSHGFHKMRTGIQNLIFYFVFIGLF